MPTINSIDSNIPIQIALGGTNSTSLSTSSAILKYNGASLITSLSAKIDNTTNFYTNTKQPCFLAYASLQSNVTGDATNYTVLFDNEVFDQGNNYDGTSTFTAPVTGKYLFFVSIDITGITSSYTLSSMGITVVSQSYLSNMLNCYQWSTSGEYGQDFCVFANMTAGDTAFCKMYVYGGTKVVNIAAGSSLYRSRFAGVLLC